MNPRIPRSAIVLGVLVLAIFSFAATVSAKDEWLQVRSKNFLLIGNASEKDIRKVGTRLEQFRETFRRLFTRTSLTSSIPTNVIVFKSDSAYKPFKPKRADGKIDTFVAGFFQPGQDINYITLSTEGDDAEMFNTIFHEYVHFIVNTNFGKSEVPPWFNEGLAEYYSTFQIENDQKAKLGLPRAGHLQLLQQSKFIPLADLFKITNYQLLQTGDHSRSIFYAESWALIHYLIQGNKGDALSKFLGLVLKDVPQEKAFQDAFQMSYADMEKELRKYVGKASYQYMWYQFPEKLTFDADMTTQPIDEATSNAYLGDLLYHVNRADDAESFLTAALKLQPEMSMANTSLGMVKLRQRKFDDAKTYLQKAIAEDQKNHMAYYQYAYLLSREGRDEFGYVKAFSDETETKMRDALKKAIALRPDFTESYELLAFVNLVNNDQLDESVALLKKALQYQPGNQRYALRIAEIMVRQAKYADAAAIASKIATTTDDPEVKSRAESLAVDIRQRQEYDQRRAEAEKRYSSQGGLSGASTLRRPAGEKQLSEEEIAKITEIQTLRSINGELRKPADTEKRLLGFVEKIDCKRGVVFDIKSGGETFSLVSKDFQGLEMNVFTPEAADLPIGCGTDVGSIQVAITYKERSIPGSTARGDLIALEFVPKNFRLLTEDEMKAQPSFIRVGPPPTSTDATSPPPLKRQAPPAPQDQEATRRKFMMDQIRGSLRQPLEGEKRATGYFDHIECTPKGNFFYFKTGDVMLKLLSDPEHRPDIKLYTQDLEGVQFGCQTKAIEFPAILVYKDAPVGKTRSAGDLLTLEFVPKTFVLEN